MLAPALLGLPYALVSVSSGLFRWPWLALYTLLPVGISLLLYEASLADPEQHGEWRDFLILVLLGLAVDLRWFEPAWGPRLAIFNKVLLLDAGIYGFLAIRQLRKVGFDLRLRLRDFGVGLFAFAAYTPIAVALGLVARLPSFPRPYPFGRPGSARMAVHLLLYCRAGRAFLSWLDAKPSRAPGWACARLCSSPQPCLGFRTSTSVLRYSIGAMSCWRLWPASSMALRGVRSAGSGHRPSPTHRWIPSGPSGCDEDDTGSSRSPPACDVGSSLAQ